MKVITLMNQKGGAGKSTVARALLSAADKNGYRSAFVDADQTGNLGSWAIEASKAGLWSEMVEAFQTLDANEVGEIVDELHEEGAVDLLIIDTAGDASRDHDAFASVADLILCPVLLSRSDLLTARGTANYLFRMKDRVGDPSMMPKFKVMLNKVGKSPSKGDLDLLERIQQVPLVGRDEENPTEMLELLPVALTEREAYKTMDSKGLLGRILEEHNNSAPKFRKNPKFMTDALAEATALLSVCMEQVGGK